MVPPPRAPRPASQAGDRGAAPVALARPVRILYLFAGPRRPGDFGEACEELGAEAICYDKETGQDLLDDVLWDEVTGRIDGDDADGGLMSPPCSTFSEARSGQGGPCALRGPEPPEIYGLPDLWPEDKEKVRIGTALALRSADAAHRFQAKGLPWLFETPRPKPGKPSVFSLPEVAALLELEGVTDSWLLQCEFGAETSKPTGIRGSFGLDDAPQRCTHRKQWWRTPWSGRWHWGSHPPLRGTQWAIEAHRWHEGMRRRSMPPGPYLTKSAALYPREFNRYLAAKLVLRAKLARAKRDRAICVPPAPPPPGDDEHQPPDLPKVQFRNPLGPGHRRRSHLCPRGCTYGGWHAEHDQVAGLVQRARPADR